MNKDKPCRAPYVCFLGSREVTRPIYGNLVGELKKTPQLLLAEVSTKWLNLKILLSYFLPGDCSYKGNADGVNQQTDSEVSVGEL